MSSSKEIFKWVQYLRVLALVLIIWGSGLKGLDAQNKGLSLQMSNVRIEDVLNKIEEKTDYSFLFNKNLVNVEQQVSLTVRNQNITAVLDKLFKDSGIIYSINGKQIVLSKVQANAGQEKTQKIKGTVTDQNGAAVIGAGIIEKGTTNGTITDAEGQYVIEVPGSAVIVVSSIGFTTAEEAVGGRRQIDVVLQEDTQLLEEIVVVGYGTQKKATVTGSVAQISGEAVNQSPVANLSNALAGRIPGVIANDRSGEPGSDASEIYIRGKGTLGDNSPLYVIDGVANRGGFGRLNPSDIESISVLKDASASIYGAQAANGVILVTTKRGNDSKPVISYEGNFSISQNTRTPKLMSAYEYMVYDDEANMYLGRDQVWKDIKGGYLDGTIDPLQYTNTDWYAATFRNAAPQTQHSISVRGGNERVKYYISGGYLYQEPGYKNTAINFSTFQVRSNLDAQITKDLTVSLELSTRQENDNKSNYSSGSYFYEIFMAYPYLYDFYPNGLPGPGISKGNNIALLATGVTGYNKIRDNFINTKVSFDLKMPWITDGLYLSGYAAFDNQFTKQKTLNDQWDAFRYNPGTKDYDRVSTGDGYINLTQKSSENRISTYNLKLGYEKRFNNHSINAFVAYEQSKAQGDWFSAYRRDFLSSSVDYLFAGSDNKKNNDGSGSISARQNYFGRLSYGYKDRYLVEFTLRYDGSQNFAKDKRWGVFPGVSAGWRISEEEFFKKNVSFMNNLKLRASWGKLGNDRVAAFQYLSTYNITNGAHFGSSPERQKGFTIGRMSNPNITWEKVDTKNIGIESQFFNGLLSFDIEYFNSNRTDILITKNASIPDYTGLTLPDQNLGEVSNQGIETSLMFRKRSDKFDYYIGGNLTYARNKIKFFDEAADIPDWQRKTGYAMDSWLLYTTDGIYQNQAEIDATPHLANAQPGDVKYLDVDGDGHITDMDKVRIHQSAIPEIVYGISMGGSWKNLELNILWTGQARAKQLIMPYGYNIDVEYFKNRWISESQTPNSKYPRAFGTQDQVNTRESDFWLKSAAFIRLKNVELAYNLPSSWLSKCKMQSARIFVSGHNLFSIDEIKILDPEGTDSAGMYYPQQRVYNVGINFSF